MVKKSDFLGDHFGDWCVMSKAPAVNRIRMWNVTNTVTDAQQVVAQTELKNLISETCPADDDCTITNGKHEMPTSREITASVLAAKFKDNPFGMPDYGDLHDDDEYPFTVDFVEEKGGFVFDPDAPFGKVFEVHGDEPDDDEFDQTTIEDFITHEDLGCCPDPDHLGYTGEVDHDGEWVAPGFGDDLADPLLINVRSAMRQLDSLRDTLDQILKAALNK